MTTPGRNGGSDEHGDVFGRGWGSMFIHVQRESGLAHRTLVLRPWQVQALRLVVSRWFAAILAVALLSWAYFALQTARVPLLTRRITHLEQDAAKIDTLQVTLEQLQRRYAQVQQMLSASTRSVTAAPPATAPTIAAAAKPGSTKPNSIAPRAGDSVAAKRAPAPENTTDTTRTKSSAARSAPLQPTSAKSAATQPAAAKPLPADSTSTKPSPPKNTKPRPDTTATLAFAAH